MCALGYARHKEGVRSTSAGMSISMISKRSLKIPTRDSARAMMDLDPPLPLLHRRTSEGRRRGKRRP